MPKSAGSKTSLQASQKRAARHKASPRKAAPRKATPRKASPRKASPRKATSRRTIRESAGEERLQKVLAAAGIGSRRHCEELILAGRVAVDQKTVTQLGTKVDASCQKIEVDAEPLKKAKLVYYAVNKPQGVVSTSSDPAGRLRVIDLVSGKERVYTVGRLDKSSDGLILLTNDGELANRLTHPRYGVHKTYQVQVVGLPQGELLSKLRSGIRFAEGVARVENVRIKSRHKQSTVLEIVLSEGRNREIRRMLAHLNHKVLRLTRIAIGPLRLGRLAPGEHRELRRSEVDALYEQIREVRGKPLSVRKAMAPGGRTSASPNKGKQITGRKTTPRKTTPRKTAGRKTADGKTGTGKKSTGRKKFVGKKAVKPRATGRKKVTHKKTSRTAVGRKPSRGLK